MAGIRLGDEAKAATEAITFGGRGGGGILV